MSRGRPRKHEKRGTKGYRPKESYLSRDPAIRAKCLANLTPGSHRKTDEERANGAKTSKSPAVVVTDAALAKMDIIEFACDVLGISFVERSAQAVILRSLYGLPLDRDQLKLYQQLTMNEPDYYEVGIEKTEGIWAIGARGGKSMLASVIALYESICKAHIWQKYLQRGETGYVVLTATRQKQCESIIQAGCSRLLEGSKISDRAKDSTLSELILTNGMRIASFPCNSTAARGLPIFLLIFDEIAHYRTEGIKADETIYNALRPRQAQFPGAKCLKITTPAAKQGLFWSDFDEGFQVSGRLTIQAPTRLVNPCIPQGFIDREYKRNPDNAAREFGAEFAETVSGFFIDCMEKLRNSFTLTEDFPYSPASHCAAIDQSGLSGRDRFAFAIAHNDLKVNKIIVDVVRSWDTKDVDIILEEIKGLMAAYHLSKLDADRYAAGWVTAALDKKGIAAELAEKLPVVYVNFRTLVLSGRLMLPDTFGLKPGLVTTQAFYGKSQTLSIAHERDRFGHGDIADAVVRAAYRASQDLSVSDLAMTPEELAGYDAEQKRLVERDNYDIAHFGLRGGDKYSGLRR